MSKSQSFISTLLCGKKKQSKPKSPESACTPSSILTFKEFINSNINAETQTPAHFDRSFKSSLSMPRLLTEPSPTSHRSMIVVKKTSGRFLPQLPLPKNESSRSDWSTSSSQFNNEISAEPLMSSNTFSEFFKKDTISWNAKYSQENPILKHTDPFVTTTDNKMPKIMPITPRNIIRNRIVAKNIIPKPLISSNSCSILHTIREKSRLDLNSDVFEGESSNSLVNL